MTGVMDTRRGKSRSGTPSDTININDGINNVGMQNMQIPDSARNELASLLQELLLKTHELSFEFSTLDYEHLRECPLVPKAQELFKVVKRLNEVVRKTIPVNP